jgi:AAA domain
MIRRITLINFMSHKETVIEPADGLTILAGEHNCGKSAIVCALQVVCGNAGGDFMVRHGKRECIVKVETDEGHVIEWRRKNDSVSYRLNGRDIHRLKGSVPEELHQLLRLPVVEAEGGDFDVHFGEQKKPIFLLNESASRRATFFASSSDAVQLLEMQNAHRRKIQDAKNRERELIKAEAKLTRRIEVLRPLDTISERLNELETAHKATGSGAAAIDDLHERIRTLSKAQETVQTRADHTSVLRRLSTPPAVQSTHSLEKTIDELMWMAGRVASDRDRVAALDVLAAPPEVDDTIALRAVIERITVESMRFAVNSARRDACPSLPAPPQLLDVNLLAQRIQALEKATKRCCNLKEHQAALASLCSVPELMNVDAVESTVGDIAIAMEQRAAKKLELQILKRCMPPPVPAESTALENHIERQSAAVDALNARTKTRDCLVILTEPPTCVDLEDLSRLVNQCAKAQFDVHSAGTEADGCRRSALDAEARLRSCAAELGTCSVCGQAIDSDKLVASSILSL